MKFRWLKLAVFCTVTATSTVQAQAYIDSPQGQYPVGTRTIDLIDDSRNPDPLAPQGVEGARKLHVKFWYPTEYYHGKRAKYFPKSGSYVEQFIESAKQQFPLSPEEEAQLRKLNGLKSYAYEDAVIRQPLPWDTEHGWPVLLYSHGSGVHERDNTELLENLASHGYVVASINHSYVSGITEFNNGDIQYRNPLFNQSEDIFFATAPKQITKDSVLVYQRLRLLNQLMFNNTLDLNSLGTVGYSFGGSNAVNVCLELTPCKAAVLLDGTQFGPAATTPLNKPLLLVESTDFPAAVEHLQGMFDLQSEDAVLLSVTGTDHSDFFDISRWIGFSFSGMDPSMVHQLTKSNVLNFFNTYVSEKTDHYEVYNPDAMKVQRK